MSDSNIINLFEKHRRGEHFHLPMDNDGEFVVSPDGFNYVSIKHTPDDTKSLDEKHHIEIAKAKHYVFKFLEHHSDSIRVDNYYVPGERLVEFMKTITNRPGKLVEIQQYIPDNPA